ncbi:3-isopropylmalate dehydratase small subunit [Nitrosopumilus sp.]|uniref:3-isopropylmalate dehydratase small subunit n=1 Tax=Nitrosopumilus sp. TaxID=2024843 RepID=UPI003B5B0757
MKKFVNVTSIVTPLDKVNVDTDQIVPKQFLKLVQKTGFGKFLFYNWRYDENEKEKTDFVLNNSRYAHSKILISGANFGCGSSREHAVWALLDYGFLVIIAPSFADIFFSNCFKNGILPISLKQEIIDELLLEKDPITVNLKSQTITTSSNEISFEIDSHKKRILLEGLDDISQTLEYDDKIRQFEENSKIPSVL